MEMTVRSIDAHLDAADNQARLSQLEVVFNEKNIIRGEGTMRVADPFDYMDPSTFNLPIYRFSNLSWSRKPWHRLLAARWLSVGRAPVIWAHHNIPVTSLLI